MAEKEGFVCIFIHFRNENNGVAAVEPAASNMPPACCIWLFKSLLPYKNTPHPNG